VTTRRAFLGALAGGLFAAPAAASAQQGKGIPRIGVLGAPGTPSDRGLLQGLRDLGYVDGKTVLLEYRSPEGDIGRLPALAVDLVRLRVDVIFAAASPHVRSARNATRTIPIVFAGVADPVGQGFVESLPRPGGNVTGVSAINVELSGKRVELLREARPNLKKVAYLFDPRDPASPPVLKAIEAGAQALGVSLLTLPAEIRTSADVDAAFAVMTRERVEGLIVAGASAFSQRSRIAELAAQHRLMVMSDSRFHVEAGSLMAYGANYEHLARRAATYVDKILKGAKPAVLPVEQPTRFELVINLKAAKSLGLTIPPSLLQRADEVIQ